MLASFFANAQKIDNFTYHLGALVRGDSTVKKLSLVFTGDQFADGGGHIAKTLKEHGIKGAFFFTGNFYRNPNFEEIIKSLVKDGHYLGAHSDRHLLYCDWNNRDSLLVSKTQFVNDLENNYNEMARFGITKEQAPFFLPPYEWYNQTISEWTQKKGLQLINMTHGTLSHADYTTPDMPNYRNSEEIYDSIIDFEEKNPTGLNGFLLLIHFGTDPNRTDKFYHRLPELITEISARGYEFVTLTELLANR
ncbi:polysaccharide deacetylase family protein [Allomuricauda sp. d1]|uniref:polysaccharide deacetylase family protein n=1 Tax=Allomuricauda sp. d1 TaxID=3136725 RepID=UPI0031D584CA